MIKLLDKFPLPNIGVRSDFCLTKIKANAQSYGFGYPFLMFWCQYVGDNPTALISRMDGDVIISASPLCDTEELLTFLNTVGFSSIQCPDDLLHNLNLTPTETYTVVLKFGDNKAIAPKPSPPLKQVYNMLYGEENESIKRVDFEGFYADLSHRIRHGTSAAFIADGGAVAVASHISDDGAVISGVVTQKEKQGMRYGSRALEGLMDSLSGRNVFAAAKNEALPFYLKNGFIITNKIAIYETEE